MKNDHETGGHAPDSAFVRDTYDALLKQLPEGYTTFRWEATPISRFHFRQSRRALQRALAYLPQTIGRTLEVGGGSGAWTPFVVPRCDTFDFLDISSQMLEQAKRSLARFNNIRYIHDDFLAWQGVPQAYDLVVSFRNLEYMNDKRTALTKMAHSLRPGGTLILSTKNPQFDWSGYFEGKALHSGQVSLRQLHTLLKESGFEVLSVYPAIIGKKTRYALVRFMWDCLQAALLYLPPALMPWFMLRYITESFLVVAKKT